MDFGVFVSILFSCFSLYFAKSITRFDPSKLPGSDLNAQPFSSIPDATLKNAILKDTIFVAHEDGSLYNVDPQSGDVRWVFSTGEPLWSSSQAFSNSDSHSDYDYIDIEDDSTIVVKGSNGKVKHKLADTAARLLKSVLNLTFLLGKSSSVALERKYIS
ncbi:hypothetical protein C5167_008567 [Papaver somniferum]|uniref:ER membrane protein complex subunit 1 n=1 Tax=Papaver somniferum TaxID=3469 RepID=A0A4Y7JXV9_PAPSO|nr:hypothetical protein C5167_008567 [Papaver somniferum]